MPTPLDDRMQRQAALQAEDRPFPLKRPLDFAPFEAALGAMPPERAVEIDRALAGATIPELGALLARRELRSAELVARCVGRIRALDVRLNAVLELNPDALAIAEERDAQSAMPGEKRGPLHGIPILLKDNIATGDRTHTSAGAAALREVRADRDALIVSRLREAGAVILGKTNMSEWANFMTSDSVNGFSALGGQARNPYGPFDVSGSSSGSAVAAACGFAVAAVGTETSGSIVSPSSQNSVCGLKPSLGAVSRDRIIPITDQQDTAGPMARNVTDLAVLFDVLCAPDPSDRMSYFAQRLFGRSFSAGLDAGALRGKRLGMPNGSFGREGDARIAERAVGVLRDAGAAVVEVALTSSRVDSRLDVRPVYHAGLKHGVDAWLRAVGAEGDAGSLRDVVSFNERDLARRAPRGQDLLAESLASAMTEAECAAQGLRNRHISAQAVRNALVDYGVDALVGVGGGLVFTAAVAGLPALSVPAGYRETGEPVGLLLVGEYGCDAELIAMAYAFEQVGRLRTGPSGL